MGNSLLRYDIDRKRWFGMKAASKVTKAIGKKDLPVAEIRRYLEPGPIVLVTSSWKGEDNVMTMGWHTVMEFTPSLVGCIIAGGNHSHAMIRKSGQCVINIPTADMLDTVVGIGNCSGADVDKFERFGLTTQQAKHVDVPLLTQCFANLECRLYDKQAADRPLRFFHLRGRQGACRALAEIPADRALHR